MDIQEIKAQAKIAIRGNLGMLIVCSIIVTAITSAAAALPSVGKVASLFVAGPLVLGSTYIYLELLHGVEPKVPVLFDGFKRFWDAVVLQLLVRLFIALWTLLLIVPGIIKAISYSMAFYILAENPDLTAKEALEESKAMMDGRKMDYFRLLLSFFGWFLLGCITLGLGFLYVIPYFHAAEAAFYESIRPAKVVYDDPYAYTDVYTQ